MCIKLQRNVLPHLHGRSDINALSPFFLLYKGSFRTRRLSKTGNEFRLARILIFRFFGILGEKSRFRCCLGHPEDSVQACSFV